MGRTMFGSVLLLTTLALSLIVGDVLVRAAQDPPTPPSTPQTQPTKQSTSSKKRTRDKVKTATPTGDQTATPGETNAPGQTTPAQPAQEQTTTPLQTRPTTAPTEQTDLSGIYAGTFNCDALGLTGDTTLTITGNQFTTADGKTGRIVASTTRGYTAVALQTGDTAPATAATTGAAARMTGATATPPIVSMRARKSGDRLTLTSVPGAAMQCSFMPARNVARGRRSPRTPAATGTEVANPAAPTTTPAQPMPEPSQTPSPSPTPVPSPTPMPTPEPQPSPEPSPSPTPVPTPTGSPTPMPSPTATPSPTPSPSPSPNPNHRPRG